MYPIGLDRILRRGGDGSMWLGSFSMSVISSSDPSAKSAGGNGSSMGGFLEFEKPLFRIQHDIEEMQREQRETGRDLKNDIKQQGVRLTSTMKRLYASLTPWETVLVARHPKRPLSTDYLGMVFRDFCELHGDRTFGDDKAIITGFARIGGHKVMFIGHNKGKDVKEQIGRASCRERV